VLAKYESLGGPVSSGLGFPVANESDGGIGPSSRIAVFSGADKPAIFWTPDHGAFVVRGAIKAAWDKLRGPTGKLGAPTSDQATDGDNVSQKFTGGKIGWNRANNTFSTDPANLAPLLSGLQVAGQNQPSGSTGSGLPSHAKGFSWQWWWLVAGIAALLLAVLVGLLVLGWWRRRHARRAAREGAAVGDYQDDHDDDYDADAHWPVAAEGAALDADDPDAVDTTPTPVVSDPGLSRAVFSGSGAPEAEHADDAYPEDLFSEGPPEEAAEDDVFSEGPPPDVAYPDDVFSEEPLPDIVHPEDVFSEGPRETVADDDVYSDDVFSEPDYSEFSRTGRHHAAPYAAGADEASEPSEPSEPSGAAPGPAKRPTIHMPLADPYQVPDGYPVKASAGSGLYYLPDSALYDDTVAEIWFASEDAALSSGFVKAD
jgi:uncharacterized protein with LGFP repeats